MNVKSLILVVLVLLICAGGVYALMSWHQDPARVANLAIDSAMSTASRLMASAENLLDAPAHKLRGQFPPQEGDFAETDISFPPNFVPNTNALDVARDGEKDLVAVINANKEAADPGYVSLAYQLAGRMAALQGFYHSCLSTSDRYQAANARRHVTELVYVLLKQAGEAEVHKIGAALNMADAEKALQNAKDDLAKVDKDIEAKTTQLADAKAKWEDLRKKTTERTAQANKMRLDADRGAPKEQLAKIEAVHKIEREEINPQYLQIDQLEASFKALQGEMELLKVRQTNAKQRLAAATGILDGFKAEGGEATPGLRNIQAQAAEGLQKARSAMATTQQDVEKTLSELAKFCESAAKTEADTNVCYKRASDLFKSAEPGSDDRVTVYAGHAEMLVAWAEDNAQSLRMYNANRIFLDQISKAWPKLDGSAVPASPVATPAPETAPATQPADAPAAKPADAPAAKLADAPAAKPAEAPAVKPAEAPTTQPAEAAPAPVALGALPPIAQKVSAYLPKPGEVRQEAVAHYTEAIDLYKKAIALAKGDYKWLYQGALGSAYAGLASVTTDPAKRQEAMAGAATTLDEALRDKQGSPYLAPVAELQKSLTQTPAPQP